MEKIENINIRPASFSDFIGQEKIKKMLEVTIFSSAKRKESLEHVLLVGQAGLGKTTLANIIANELGGKIIATSAPSLEKNGDLAGLLSLINPGDVLFIDEIHRLNKSLEELLYSAIEDYKVSITVNNNGVSKPLIMKLPPFTLIGATTKMGSLSHSFYDRFTLVLNFEYYSQQEICLILKRTARIFKMEIDDESCKLIAQRSRETPRVANKILKKIRDYYLYKELKKINKNDTLSALDLFSIDSLGLEELDRKYLLTLINEYKGGPVGVSALASRLNQEETNLIEIVEPFLLRQRLIIRGPRGRLATTLAYEHFGLKNPDEKGR